MTKYQPKPKKTTSKSLKSQGDAHCFLGYSWFDASRIRFRERERRSINTIWPYCIACIVCVRKSVRNGQICGRTIRGFYTTIMRYRIEPMVTVLYRKQHAEIGFVSSKTAILTWATRSVKISPGRLRPLIVGFFGRGQSQKTLAIACYSTSHFHTSSCHGKGLLHDNATSHTSKMVRNYLETLNWEVLPHAAYSPDLDPSEYHLFS